MAIRIEKLQCTGRRPPAGPYPNRRTEDSIHGRTIGERCDFLVVLIHGDATVLDENMRTNKLLYPDHGLKKVFSFEGEKLAC